MNQSASTSAPGASLLPGWTGTLTTAHLAVIAFFAVLVVIGIVWGARLKARRHAAEREVIARNEQIADTPAASAGPETPEPEVATPSPQTPAFQRVAANDGDGGADGPVTQLKGLGPKVADRLGELGITTVGQIAALSDDGAAALDAQLGPFAGRMGRDRWLEQARFLAAGDRAGFEAVFGRL